MATPLPDEPEEKAARIARARTDKLFFFATYLPHYFTLAPADFHKELVTLLEVKGTPVAVAAPREHAKSTIVTLGYPLHQICFSQRNFIIIVSDSEYQAVDFVRFIRLELEENERIKQDFGSLRTESDTWADASFVTKNSVKVLARGSGQKVRGLRHRQHRPDMVVMDDIENDQGVRNPQQVDKLLRWITGSVFPCIEQKGSLFIIGTILARKSALYTLLYGEDYTAWIRKTYRALVPSPIGGEGKGEGGLRPLWPERHSLESLKHKKEIIGSVQFNREYQNDPKDEEGIFREDWLRYYHPSELQGKQLDVYTFIDPSVDGKDTSDYKAIITIGRAEGIFYVLDAFIKKVSIDAMLRAVYTRFEQFRPLVIGIEDNVFQKLLLREFDAMAAKTGQYLPMRGVTHTANKQGRITSLSALVERGIIRFQRNHSDQAVLIEQLIYFPTSTVNDDGPDALEAAIALANVRQAACLGVDPDHQYSLGNIIAQERRVPGLITPTEYRENT
jgi:predicted phage terminase large subunit-like protein